MIFSFELLHDVYSLVKFLVLEQIDFQFISFSKFDCQTKIKLNYNIEDYEKIQKFLKNATGIYKFDFEK